jgi:uncharacterized membrane protein
VLHYFIQVIQNSLAASVLTALIFASVFKDGIIKGKYDGISKRIFFRQRILLWGAGTGIIAAMILSVLRRTTALINRSLFNTWILSIGIIAGIIFLLLLWGLLRKKNSRLHEGALTISASVLLWAILFYALPTIFLYPAEFVSAGESIISTELFFKSAGFLGGLVVSFLVGWGLFIIGKGLGILPLRIITGLCLCINMLNQLSNVIQYLFARRIIPMNRRLFSIIMIAMNQNVIFLYLILGIIFLLSLFVLWGTFHSSGEFRNPAEHRKFKAALRRTRRLCVFLILGLGVSVFSLSFLKSYEGRSVVLSPAEPMNIEGDEIIIPIEGVEDGHLHRFAWTASDGTEMRFIVIKKNAAAYGVGLDACDICGNTGYYERKDEVICRLCDVVMNKSTIGFKGGCNPVPLEYRLRSGNMVVQTADLEKEKSRFK